MRAAPAERGHLRLLPSGSKRAGAAPPESGVSRCGSPAHRLFRVAAGEEAPSSPAKPRQHLPARRAEATTVDPFQGLTCADGVGGRTEDEAFVPLFNPLAYNHLDWIPVAVRAGNAIRLSPPVHWS